MAHPGDKLSGRRRFRRKVLLLLLSMMLLPFQAECFTPGNKLISNGGYLVEDDTAGLRYREKDLFVPASTIKILTSLISLEKLGPSYRFKTLFYLDPQKNLYIKGYGDPFLTSEHILEIGKNLRQRGVTAVNTLYLDDSAFALAGETASVENSENPYDAPNGALAVNFNALPMRVSKSGSISSGEPQTPLLSLMRESAARRTPGRYRINVGTLETKDQLTPVMRYTGELFLAQFEAAGILMPGKFTKNVVPEDLRPLYIHHSAKSLEEIIRACLKNSNNYIANQLFLVCGAQSLGLPATWKKSRQTFDLYIRDNLNLTKGQILIKEGSGISRQNRISPKALITILDHFKPYSQLLKRKREDILLKSGTMTDVYCYAGYFGQQRGLTPFVILLNQAENTRDRLLRALHAALPGRPLLRPGQ